VLEECAANRENSLEVRVNAIQAFRFLSCESSRALLLRILRNQEDTELKINAFLVGVKCQHDFNYTPETEALLNSYLENEEDIQVNFEKNLYFNFFHNKKKTKKNERF
jgi:hypothetical protein